MRIGIRRRRSPRRLAPTPIPMRSAGRSPSNATYITPRRRPPAVGDDRGGRLTRITLSEDSEVATREGLRVGDPANAVTQAYGDSPPTLPHEYSPRPRNI